MVTDETKFVMNELERQVAELIAGTRGFISLKTMRRAGHDHTTNWFRRYIADFPDLCMEKHGRYGWCIYRCRYEGPVGLQHLG